MASCFQSLCNRHQFLLKSRLNELLYCFTLLRSWQAFTDSQTIGNKKAQRAQSALAHHALHGLLQACEFAEVLLGVMQSKHMLYHLSQRHPFDVLFGKLGQIEEPIGP